MAIITGELTESRSYEENVILGSETAAGLLTVTNSDSYDVLALTEKDLVLEFASEGSMISGAFSAAVIKGVNFSAGGGTVVMPQASAAISVKNTTGGLGGNSYGVSSNGALTFRGSFGGTVTADSGAANTAGDNPMLDNSSAYGIYATGVLIFEGDFTGKAEAKGASGSAIGISCAGISMGKFSGTVSASALGSASGINAGGGDFICTGIEASGIISADGINNASGISAANVKMEYFSGRIDAAGKSTNANADSGICLASGISGGTSVVIDSFSGELTASNSQGGAGISAKTVSGRNGGALTLTEDAVIAVRATTAASAKLCCVEAYTMNLSIGGTLFAGALGSTSAASNSDMLAMLKDFRQNGEASEYAETLIKAAATGSALSISGSGGSRTDIEILSSGIIFGSISLSYSGLDTGITVNSGAVLYGGISLGRGTDTISVYAGASVKGAINSGKGDDTLALYADQEGLGRTGVIDGGTGEFVVRNIVVDGGRWELAASLNRNELSGPGVSTLTVNSGAELNFSGEFKDQTVKGGGALVLDGASGTVTMCDFTGDLTVGGASSVALWDYSSTAELAASSVTFDITSRSADAGAMLSGAYSCASASAAVNVVASSGSLEAGKYVLTSGAAWSDESISAITLNGGAWDAGIYGYILSDLVYDAESGELYFTVADELELSGNVSTDDKGNYTNETGASVEVNGAVISNNLYAAVSGSATLTVTSGNIKNIFAGAKFENGGETGNISATVGGGNITITRVYCGNAVLGGTVTTENTTLTISGSLAYQDQNNGVWCYGAGIAANTGTLKITSTATSETLKIADDKGGGISKVEVTAYGSVGSIVGGGRAQNSGSLDVNATSVTIDNATVTNAIGGAYNSGTGSVTVGTAEMTINSTATVTTVFGGNFIAPVGDNVSSANNSITDVKLTINGAVASNAVFGGNYMKAGSATITGTVTLDINGGSATSGFYGGGFIVGAASETITDVNITVGGTVIGNIFAGACVSGEGGSSTVTTANITVEANSNVTGNVYAGGYSVAGAAKVVTSTITFSGSSVFNGKVCATSAGSVKTDAPMSTVVFSGYDGEFGGAFAGTFDIIQFTADSSVDFTRTDFDGLKTDAVQITGMDASYDAGDENASHVFFSLGSRRVDISKISVNGGRLERINDVLEDAFTYFWNDTTKAFGYVGAEAIASADKEGYTFYKLLA